MSNFEVLPLSDLLSLTIYPTADIFPMLLDSDPPPAGYEGMTMSQFADQILREGVREPLIIWNNFLLDGRNRREAAKLASSVKPEVLAGLGFDPADLSSIPVRYVEFKDEEEADSWVLSLNIDRRTMNKDQLACIAVRYWEIEQVRMGRPDKSAQNSADFSLTRKKLASRFHVGENYIQKARSLFINDKPKFDKAASGKEKVIGKLVSPGQKIKPDTDPNELALQQTNDAFNKINAAMDVLVVSNSDTYVSAKNNVKLKIERLVDQFNDKYGVGFVIQYVDTNE